MTSPSKHATLSGSGYGRGLACSAAYALPHVDSTSDAAERGTAIHAYISSMLRDGEAVPVEAAVDMQTVIELANRGNAFWDEIALVYDAATDTVRVVDCEHRDYGELKPTEIPMTLDLVVRDESTARIYDWKTGTYCDEAQLRIAALAVARWLPVDTVEVAFAFLQRDGSWELACEQTFGALDFDEIADEARTVVANVARDREAVAAGLVPNVQPGSHCGFCGAKSQCPEYVVPTAQIVPAMRQALSLSDIDTAPDDVLAEHYERVQRAKALIEEHEAAVCARAAAKPLTLANGDVLTLAPGEARDKIDDAIAGAVLTQRYGADVAVAAASYSKASVKRALGADTDDALKAIREAGGIEKKAGEPKVRVIKNEPKALPRKRGKAA